MGKIITKPEPYNYSNYERTGNNAIDLVAQAVGYHRKMRRPLKSITLKPTYYDLFFCGTEVLQKEKIDPQTVLLFDGVEIKRGSNRQWDNMVFDFHPVYVKNIN